VETIKVTRGSETFYIDASQLSAVLTTQALHNKAVSRILRSVQWRSDNESGERLAQRRLARADKQTERKRAQIAKRTERTKEDATMAQSTDKARKGTTPEAGTLAATLLERSAAAKQENKAPTNLESAIRDALLSSQGRDPVDYRDNITVDVTNDGRLAFYVDISDALEWSDNGYGMQLATTYHENPRTGKGLNYVYITPSVGLRLAVVLYNTPKNVKDNPLSYREQLGQE